jgi:hypothetical protein
MLQGGHGEGGQTVPAFGIRLGLPLPMTQLAVQLLLPHVTAAPPQDIIPNVHSILHGPSSLQINFAFLQLSVLEQFIVHLCPGGQTKVFPSHAPSPVQSMIQSVSSGHVIVPGPLYSSFISAFNRHAPATGLSQSTGHVAAVGGTETPHAHCSESLHNSPLATQSSVPEGTGLHVPIALS